MLMPGGRAGLKIGWLLLPGFCAIRQWFCFGIGIVIRWIMLTASHYDLRYTGVVNELLKTLEDAKDYQNLHKYAAQSLAVAPGNVKAHYWLIVAMFNLGADEMADTQLEAAKRALTDEEYYELVEALKKAKITEPSNLFRNEKLSI